jgi:hypothetical protein
LEISYGELAKKARDQVKDLDEPYKSLAYQTVLQELIQEAKKPVLREMKPAKRIAAAEAAENPVEVFLTNKVSAAQYARLFAVRGNLVEKCLAVLKLARDELGIDGLTATQIYGILVKKFRVARVYRSNVSNDLGKATEYVTRLKTNDEYKYLLMAAGEQRLDEVVGQSK